MNILPFNQPQVKGRAKFTYFSLGKMFKKQIKTIEDQGEQQIKALEDLKPKEQIKVIKGKSNNQSIAANILNNLIKKRKSIKNELLI